MFFQKKENVAKKVAIGSAIALTAGYVAGVLTAPKSGKETRADLKKAASKSAARAEKELKKLNSELDKTIKQAKATGAKASARTKQELDALTVKAKEAKATTRELLSAVRSGGADNKELDKAIKEANDSIEHLKQYLKKK